MNEHRTINIKSYMLFKSRALYPPPNDLFLLVMQEGVTTCSQRGKSYCDAQHNHSVSQNFLFKGLYSGTPQSISTLQRRTDEGRLNWKEIERVHWIQSMYLGSKLLFGKYLISGHLGLDTSKLKNTFYLSSHAKSLFWTQPPTSF